MNMQTIISPAYALLTAALLLMSTALSSYVTYPLPTFGADATQVAATFSSSTAQTVAATAITISATSTGCTSRNISTAQKGLMLTFDDSKTPTGTFGTWQAASTTETYDAGQWGCGAIKAVADATSNVTVNVFK